MGTDTYDRRCCNGFLIEQGIGVIQGEANFNQKGAFNEGYDTGYDTEATQP
jgi:hypothetical protein